MLFWAFGIGHSAEHVGKSQVKCKKQCVGKHDRVRTFLESMDHNTTTNSTHKHRHTQQQPHPSHTPHKTPHHTPHTTIQHTPDALVTDRDVRHTVFSPLWPTFNTVPDRPWQLVGFFCSCFVKCRLGVAHSFHVSARPSFTMQGPCSIDRPTFVILGERKDKSNHLTAVFSAVSLRIAGVEQLYQVKQVIGGIGHVLFFTYAQTSNGQNPVVTLGQPLVQVITPRGPFHGKQKIGDEGRT